MFSLIALLLLLASCATTIRPYRACLEVTVRYPYKRHLAGVVISEQPLKGGAIRFHFVPDADRTRTLAVTCADCINRNCSTVNAHAASTIAATVSNRRIQ
jgi:hypothetical protein